MHTSNPAQLARLIEEIFLKQSVMLLTNGQATPVKLIGFNSGMLELTAPATAAEVRQLLVTHRNYDMRLECQVIEKTPNATELLKPLQLKAEERVRKEARTAITVAANTTNFISNCIQVTAIFHAFSAMNAKRDALIKFYNNAVKERLPDDSKFSVQLRKTKRLDHKMRVIDKYQRPIFAPNRHDPYKMSGVDAGRFVPAKEYQELLRHEHGDKNQLGEICEPIWLRGLLLIGYLQISAPDELTEEHYRIVEKLARRLGKIFCVMVVCRRITLPVRWMISVLPDSVLFIPI